MRCLSRNARHACRALWAAPRRFAFSCTSISLGIAALVAMLGIGATIKAEALLQFEQSGVQLIRFGLQRPGASVEAGHVAPAPLDIALLQKLLAEHDIHAKLLPIAKIDNCQPDPALMSEVVGIDISNGNFDLGSIIGAPLLAGQRLQRHDAYHNEALFGYDAARELSRSRGYVPLGQSVSNCALVLRMQGILQKVPDNSYVLPFNPNKTVFLALPALKRLAGAAPISETLIRFSDSTQVENDALRLKRAYEQARAVPVVVTTPAQLLATMHEQTASLTASLLVGGLLVLIIGALGVMENLLTSISARRAEIGIRLSVGAAPEDIGQQFAMEALILVAAGGGIGLALGSAASWGYASWNHLPWVLSPQGALASAVMVGTVGFVSGFFPARLAAKVNPVESIRY